MTRSSYVYRIRDWAANFESSESRKVKLLGWFRFPNNFDGLSYRRVTQLPEAPKLFCGWVLIVGVASKCPVRGTLANDDGPLTAEDLALMTGFPVDVFELAFTTLAGPSIGWLIREKLELKPDHPDEPGDHPDEPGDHPDEPGEGSKPSPDRGEERRGEENRGDKKRGEGAGVAGPHRGNGAAKAAVDFPEVLDTAAFREKWGEWEQHLREKRKTLTPTARRRQLGKLATFGETGAIGSIDQSLENGWVGVFELRGSSGVRRVQGGTGMDGAYDPRNDITHPDYEPPPLTPELIRVIEGRN